MNLFHFAYDFFHYTSAIDISIERVGTYPQRYGSLGSVSLDGSASGSGSRINMRGVDHGFPHTESVPEDELENTLERNAI